MFFVSFLLAGVVWLGWNECEGLVLEIYMGVMEWMNEDNGHGDGNVDVNVCGWRMYLYVMDRLEKVTDVFLMSFSS
jgi:hypothetical protein